MAFEKNRLSIFFFFPRYAFLKAKIWLPNVDFHHFFYSERLIHSKKKKKKKTRKKIFIYPVKTVLEIFTSSSAYPFFGFSIFIKTWKYYLYTYQALCMKFGVSIFISFGDTKHWILLTHSQAYTHTYIHTN